jgi:hypothetical protein
MASWSWKAGLASVAIIAVTAHAAAQMSDQPGIGSPNEPAVSPPSGMPAEMRGHMMQMMQRGMHGGTGQHNMMGMHGGMTGQPTLPGQDAFGAIQEVVQILEADPATDWSKVNIDALREHLIDMNELTLNAAAAERVLDNGIEIAVTGEGRALEAIKRMVPAHVAELVKLGWNAKTEDMSNGLKFTVTTSDPKELTKLKALGFMGIMVQGGHHQSHHLMMAKGELPQH